MKSAFFCLIVPLFFAACNDSMPHEHGHQEQGSEASPSSPSVPSNPVSIVDGVTLVEMTGNDQMKYNLESFTVRAGGKVKVTLINRGKMPKAAMGHNVVFLAKDVNANAFAAAAASARDSEYIPADFNGQIIAATKLLGPGESDTVEFTAPVEPGKYVFLCSFPAHMFAGMRGVMLVQ